MHRRQQHLRAAGMDAACVEARRACTWVVFVPENCVSARRAATQPRSAAISSARRCAARGDARSSRCLTQHPHPTPTRDAPRRTRCHHPRGAVTKFSTRSDATAGCPARPSPCLVARHATCSHLRSPCSPSSTWQRCTTTTAPGSR